MVVDYLEESFRSTAVLHIRPSAGADGRHIEAVPLGEKFGLERSESILRRPELLHALVLPPAAVFFLQLFDQGREDERSKTHCVLSRPVPSLRRIGSGKF